jgi:hypothetical protein
MPTEIHSSKLTQFMLFVLGLGATVAIYFLLQIVAAFALFFIYGSGEIAGRASTRVGAWFVAVHVGLLFLLFRKQILYTTWLAWAINTALAIGLFCYLELYHPS